MRNLITKTGWERFFNWQSDLDWTWGPFLTLRPNREKPIRPWVWLRLFLIFTGLGLLLIGAAASVFLVLLKAVAAPHSTVSPVLRDTLTTLQEVLLDATTQAVLFGLLLSLPLLFTTFCFPYHWAWNRRAERLCRLPRPPGDIPNVWPPAPSEKLGENNSL